MKYRRKIIEMEEAYQKRDAEVNDKIKKYRRLRNEVKKRYVKERKSVGESAWDWLKDLRFKYESRRVAGWDQCYRIGEDHEDFSYWDETFELLNFGRKDRKTGYYALHRTVRGSHSVYNTRDTRMLIFGQYKHRPELDILIDKLTGMTEEFNDIQRERKKNTCILKDDYGLNDKHKRLFEELDTEAWTFSGMPIPLKIMDLVLYSDGTGPFHDFTDLTVLEVCGVEIERVKDYKIKPKCLSDKGVLSKKMTSLVDLLESIGDTTGSCGYDPITRRYNTLY